MYHTYKQAFMCVIFPLAYAFDNSPPTAAEGRGDWGTAPDPSQGVAPLASLLFMNRIRSRTFRRAVRS